MVAKEHAPITQDLSYGLLSAGSTVIWSVLAGWLLYFYRPPNGPPLVPAALYGVVVLSVRLASALFAAPIGYLSDHTRGKWGRRLPYMAISGLPMIVFFVLLWTPPEKGESIGNLIYLTVVFALHSAAYTFHQIPTTALLPDIAVTESHRVRISAISSGAMLVGMVVSALAGPLIDKLGYSTMAVIFGIALLPTLYLPLLVLRERPGRQIEVEQRLTFRQAVSAVLRNPAFLTLTAAGALYWSTTAFVQGALPFIVTEVCLLSEASTFIFYAPAIAASLICYPIIIRLVRRFGKWQVFTGSLLASAVVLPGLLLIGPWMPLSLKAQGLVWVTLQATAMAGVMMLPPAFGAEITDYDEQLTGQRREGIYYATWGLFDQVINGAAAALLPLILLLGSSHTAPQGALGVRLVGPICGVMMLVAFLVFRRYPLRPATLASASEGGDNR